MIIIIVIIIIMACNYAVAEVVVEFVLNMSYFVRSHQGYVKQTFLVSYNLVQIYSYFK